MQSSTKISSEELLSVISRHYPTSRVINIEDLSTGCDNWIFCVTISTNTENDSENEHGEKVIARFPRKLGQPDCPKMHFPKFQAYILEILDKNGIPGPKLLHLSSEYLIESFVSEIDFSKMPTKDDENQSKQVFTQMGFYTKKLHSIDCCQGFGYIVEIDTNREKLIGKYDNWLEMFEQEFPDNLKGCFTKNFIDQNMFDTINQLFIDLKPYLRSYSEPKLLHSDICSNNTRVALNRAQNEYEFTGFIDFADCMAGDPMFDLGELLLSCYGNYTMIEWFECGYGVLSAQDKSLIIFYAIHYNIWLLESSVLTKVTKRWLKTLQKLITLIN